jgi:2-methylisocitrate lyase-like PEP mutase family enzyme
MMLEARADSNKIVAHACSYDGLSSRLVEEAGFPMVFLSVYSCSSTHGLPDTGYIAMAEMCDKIQETVRQVSVPVMADADTGYGSPMNVKRTVQCFVEAGAAGIMLEDQTWPKRMLNTQRYQNTLPRLTVCRLRSYQGQVGCVARRGVCTCASSCRRS